jgi:ABC-type Mn2+/Zn2+ transport system permease subunit
VIEAFQASWSLFYTTYIAGGLIALLLALIGVWVVARDQIFLGLAVSQASTLGIAIALWLGGLGTGSLLAWLGSDPVAAALAVIASIGTALLTSRAGGAGRESPEAVTGWVYLVAASVAVLLVANSPHGLEEVHRLVFSTLLAASRQDPWVFGVLAVATIAAAARWRSELVLLAMDPEMAAAVGLRTRVWNAAIAVWLGLAVGLSIRVSGMLFTVGCLVLPALIAKNLCRDVRPVLVVAPILSVLACAAGFVLAHVFDFPPAHSTVALLCGALTCAWGMRRSRLR